MSETFEEWCYSTGMEDARVVLNDMVSMEVLKDCWDRQEKKIQAEREKVEKLEAKLAEKQLTIDAIYNIDIDTKFMYDGEGFHEQPTDTQVLNAIFELIGEREPKWGKLVKEKE